MIDATKNISEINSLSFVRIKVDKLVRAIPYELIDSVKGRTFTPEQFYKYQEEQIKNPYNFLYALINTNKKIQGYLWAEKNALDGSLFINTFSINKEYWNKGESIPKVIDFLLELKKELKSPRVFWLTSNEKFFIQKGFKRSKIRLLEYNSN